MENEVKNQSSEVLEQKLIELYDYVSNTATKGSEFLQSELPLVAQEIIYSKMLGGCYNFVISFIFIVLGIYFHKLHKFNFKNYKPQNFESNDPWSVDRVKFPFISAKLCYVAATIFIIIGILNIIYTLVCPRLVILDYLKGLI